MEEDYRLKRRTLPLDSPLLCQNPSINTVNPMPASSSRSGQNLTFQLPKRSLQIAGIAFVAGLVLFVIVWLSSRHNNDFYRAGPAQTDTQVEAVVPLPEPLAAGAGASEMPDARPPAAEEKPQVVETAAAPVPAPVPETPVAVAPAGPLEPSLPATSDLPVPLPGQSPPPPYPPAALRRGESGTTVVRVDVDASGHPIGISVVQRSGSRELDRAAVDAVRDWRFQPAHSKGQPVAASLEIPFDFKPAQ